MGWAQECQTHPKGCPPVGFNSWAEASAANSQAALQAQADRDATEARKAQAAYSAQVAATLAGKAAADRAAWDKAADEDAARREAEFQAKMGGYLATRNDPNYLASKRAEADAWNRAHPQQVERDTVLLAASMGDTAALEARGYRLDLASGNWYDPTRSNPTPQASPSYGAGVVFVQGDGTPVVATTDKSPGEIEAEQAREKAEKEEPMAQPVMMPRPGISYAPTSPAQIPLQTSNLDLLGGIMGGLGGFLTGGPGGALLGGLGGLLGGGGPSGGIGSGLTAGNCPSGYTWDPNTGQCKRQGIVGTMEQVIPGGATGYVPATDPVSEILGVSGREPMMTTRRTCGPGWVLAETGQCFPKSMLPARFRANRPRKAVVSYSDGRTLRRAETVANRLERYGNKACRVKKRAKSRRK